MRTVTVDEFGSLAEAEPLRRRLVAAGIPAELHTEPKLNSKLNLSRVTASVRVEVPREVFETALRIVYDWYAAGCSETTMPGQTDAVPGSTTVPGAGSSASPPS